MSPKRKYRRHVLCTQAQYQDGRGLPDEWERRIAYARRPPWMERRTRFIERRLWRSDYPVHVWLCHSDSTASGLVIAEVPVHRAGISRRKLLRLFPYLREWGWTMVDDWGEALLKGHLHDFERGIADAPAWEWEHAVSTSPHHRHYGLLFLYDPARLVFAMYPQRVADEIKQSLAAAAAEGNG